MIEVKNLSFSIENRKIIQDISIVVNKSQFVGIIGANGSGKSTLLKNVYRFFKYDSGDIKLKNIGLYDYSSKDLAKEMAVLAQKQNMNFDFSVEEIVEMGRYAYKNSIFEVEKNKNSEFVGNALNAVGMYNMKDRSFLSLSGGEMQRVLIARALAQNTEILILDEPTNHLDINARKIVSRYLKGKKSFILVSHDRNLLDSCIDHILSINKTNIEIQKGNFSTWEKNKRQQDELEIYQNRKLKKEIKRLVKSSKRVAVWSDKVEKTKNLGMGDKGYIGHMAAKMMKRAKSIEKRSDRLIEEKSQLLHNIDIDEKLKLSPLIFHSKRLIEFKNVSLFYNNRLICRDINFKINQGEIISLTGKNGSGKSTILKLIIGKNVKYTGNIYCAKNLKISYVSQDTSDLKGNLFEYIEEKQIDKTLFLSILSKMGFNSLQFEKDISDYSEGQKKKILITASLCEKAHLYIWDEPLNFIDIMSRIQIEELILNYRPTLLFVEHDELFNKKVADRFINL